MYPAVAFWHAEIGRRVHRPAGQQHLEVQVHAVGQAAMADDAQLLARRDSGFAFGQGGRDHAEMAVDPDETVVLHHHFEPAGLAREALSSCTDWLGRKLLDKVKNRFG